MGEILFYILATITLGTAFLTIFAKSTMHSALYLIICMASLAGHYLLLNAQFLAIVQLIVYTGAIMVLMVFTIMLLHLDEDEEKKKSFMTKIAATFAFCLVGAVLLTGLLRTKPVVESYFYSGEDFQSIKVLGQKLLGDFMVPFEFASVLLLVAMIGAVLISKKSKQKEA